MFDLGKLRIPGHDDGVFLLCDRNGNGIGAGHWEVGLDLRCCEGKAIVAGIKLKRKGLELADDFLGKWMAVLPGESVIHLPKVDDAQEERNLPSLSLSEEPLDPIRAALVLDPGQDGE